MFFSFSVTTTFTLTVCYNDSDCFDKVQEVNPVIAEYGLIATCIDALQVCYSIWVDL